MNELNLFWQTIARYPDADYLRATFAFAAAPTVWAGKPATTVTLHAAGRNLLGLWHARGAADFLPDGLAVRALRASEASETLLLYRPALLDAMLRSPANRRFLAQAGYPPEADREACLTRLSRRCAAGCPHEIGLFLGIPLHDVQGFIRGGGAGWRFCRYWKVYAQETSARQTFARYDAARALSVRRILRQGCAQPARVRA